MCIRVRFWLVKLWWRRCGSGDNNFVSHGLLESSFAFSRTTPFSLSLFYPLSSSQVILSPSHHHYLNYWGVDLKTSLGHTASCDWTVRVMDRLTYRQPLFLSLSHSDPTFTFLMLRFSYLRRTFAPFFFRLFACVTAMGKKKQVLFVSSLSTFTSTWTLISYFLLCRWVHNIRLGKVKPKSILYWLDFRNFFTS